MMQSHLSLKRISLLLLVIIVSLLHTGNVLAACPPIVVSTDTDSGPGSLRQAIIDICDGGTITFDGDHTIALDTELTIGKSMTIDGDTHTITVSGQDKTRVFQVTAGTVIFDTLVIANGAVKTAENWMGGGIMVQEHGVVTVTDSIVTNNVAAGFDGSSGDGGGICTYGTLTINHSTISDNTGEYGGGIMVQEHGVVTVTDSIVTNNAAAHNGNSGFGGGICTYGTLTINHSTISENTALLGGAGIFIDGGSGKLTVTNSTLSNNKSHNGSDTGTGGGFQCDSSSSSSPVSTFTNTTFSGNQANGTADDGGGAIMNYRGDVTLDHVTLIANSTATTGKASGIANAGGTINITNGIIGHTDTNPDCSGTITSNGYNLVSDASCSFSATGDITAPNLLVGALADNGGDTFTHALLPGSPAINTGECSSGPLRDQRGITRPQDATCDIGAFEVCSGSATIVVTTDADSGAGSLRQAIVDICDGGTITFDGDRTITLATELTIGKSMTIDGGAHAITVSGDDKTRVFQVTAGTVIFDTLVIANGKASTEDWPGFPWTGSGIMIQQGSVVTVTDCTVKDNVAAEHDGKKGLGGGIGTYGKLTINNSTISGNSCQGLQSLGGGIYLSYGSTTTINNSIISGNSGAYGGGIYAGSTDALFPATLTVNSSRISDNTGDVTGGGIYLAHASTITINNSIISGNDSPTGAGIFVGSVHALSPATLTVTNSTISGNTRGAGLIIMDNSTVTIDSSTISGNTCTTGGAGISNNSSTLTVTNSTFSNNIAHNGSLLGTGGGFQSVSVGSTSTLTNTTFSGNQANGTGDDGGGAIMVYGGDVTLDHVTLIANSTATVGKGSGIANAGGTISITNSIIGHTDTNPDCTGAITSNGYNLVSDPSCSFSATGDITDTDLVIGALADNGGDTFTYALLPGSPAINAGECSSGPAADQRGITRPQDGTCDIGAFEVNGGYTLALSSGSSQSTDIRTAFANPLVLTVASSTGEPLEGGKITFTAPGSGASLNSTPQRAVIGSGGSASLPVTANDTAGSYDVTADASGNLSATPLTYSLTNLATAPTVTTDAATAVGSKIATLNGTVNANSADSTVTFEYGLTESYGANVTADQSPVTGSSDAAVSKTITGLLPYATYHYRAVGLNSIATSTGADMTFTTDSIAPILTTNSATGVEANAAILNGSVNANNAETTVTFEYGTSSSYGTTVNATPHTVSGMVTTSVTFALTGLLPDTTYHYRVVGANIPTGTTRGADGTFTTLATVLPTVLTEPVSVIAAHSVLAAGNVTADGNATASRGLCLDTSADPALGSGTTATCQADSKGGTGTFSYQFSGLQADTTFYVRAYATNIIGTAYGSNVTFTTLIAVPTVTTTAPDNITSSAATTGGNVTDAGGGTVDDRGVCWSTSVNPSYNPTTCKSAVTPGGTGAFTVEVTNLSPGTTYHIRAYGHNNSPTDSGYGYGNDLTLTTAPVLATVSTTAPTVVTASTATSGGNVSNSGGATIAARGVCWSTSTDPSIHDTCTHDSTGTGTYTSSITGLSPGTLYHVRAYATSSVGAAYGTSHSFTTETYAPVLSTTVISAITDETAFSGGTISDDGGEDISAKGVCWSTSAGPTISDSHTNDGTGDGKFTSAIPGLTAGTEYHVRAYATYGVGTSYGSDRSFTTLSVTPQLTTTAVSNIDVTTATGGGNVLSNGGAAITARGVCWDTDADPDTSKDCSDDGTGIGSFSSSITGLTHGTQYYVRAYATNENDTTYGANVSFTTDTIVPVVTTADASNISHSSATGGGDVTDAGGAAITAKGVCWSTSMNPTADCSDEGAGDGSFQSTISSLTPGTVYYIRAYATNTKGTTYGPEKHFLTLPMVPVLTTTAISDNTTGTSAGSGGEITDDHGAPVTERGVCWSTSAIPTYADSCSHDGTDAGIFSSALSSLEPGTLYHVRSYASNSAGIGYGDSKPFTTIAILATVTTSDPISSITAYSAQGGGEVTADGGAGVTAKGICWDSTNPTPDLGDTCSSSGTGTGVFLSAINTLSRKTGYNVRAYATNSAGTAYGSVVAFTSAPLVPTVNISGTSGISDTSFTVTGAVSDNGGEAITVNGACLRTTEDPTGADICKPVTVASPFVVNFTGLNPGTHYLYRTYATNTVGTGYSSTSSITTLPGVATVSTKAVTAIQAFQAQAGGDTISDGGTAIQDKGICWSLSTAPHPVVGGNCISSGSGTGSFIGTMSGLTPDSGYLVRAYAINSVGTAYGADADFHTLPGPPTLMTTPMVWINEEAAQSGGNTIADHGLPITDRGVCWNLTGNPGLADSCQADTTGGTADYTVTLSSLAGKTIYFVRAYASNTAGTGYGAQVQFETLPGKPHVETEASDTITVDSAISHGHVISSGGFQVTHRGICWGTNSDPDDTSGACIVEGGGTGEFVVPISGLSLGTTYHVRAYGENEKGRTYGADSAFTTLAIASTVTTTVPFDITKDSASSGGTVTADGGSPVTERGLCLSTTIDPTTLDTCQQDTSGGIGTFVIEISGLEKNTTYHVRAYSINSVGTSYGQDESFTTSYFPWPMFVPATTGMGVE